MLLHSAAHAHHAHRHLWIAIPALAIGLLAARASTAAVFHVDNGNASCSSLDPARGSAAVPYCSIKQAIDEKGGPGDTILVHPGIYREDVIVSKSGTIGNPLVVLATGPGVVVDGSDPVTGWTTFSGDVWQAPVVWTPRRVFADGAALALSTGAPGSLPANSFEYDPGTTTLYVNLGGDPGTHVVLASHRDNVFRLFGHASVTIAGFDVAHANVVGISVSGGSDIEIARNRVHDCGDHGISLLNGVTDSRVIDNESFGNARLFQRAANGIILQGSTTVRIEGNSLHHNEDTGLQMNLASSQNLSIQNRSWRNGDHGFDHLASPNNIHIGDVAWGNFQDGFSFEGNSSGGRMFDCISVDNGLTAPTPGATLRVDSTSAVGLVSDYNLFWNSTGPVRIEYLGGTGHPTFFSTLASYQSFSGLDAHTLSSDPQFVDAPAADFHLREGSPAIDSGTSLPPDWPAFDAEGQPRADDPAIPNTGEAGPGRPDFADRGALEFQPPLPPPSSDNLCGNPSFEQNLNGWTGYHCSLERIQGSAHDGHYFVRINPVPPSNEYGLNDSPSWILSTPAAGTRYRFSAWVRSASAHGPVGFLIREYLGSTAQGVSTHSAEVALGPDWAQVTVERVAVARGSWLDLHLIDEVSGETFDVDNVSIQLVGPPTGNQPPVAQLAILPSASGTAPFAVTANASASTDDVGIASYRFDFGDGTTLPPQTTPTATHTYAAGTWTAQVTVADAQGATASASVTVHVANPVVNNLCGNPSFERSLEGWSASSGSKLVRASGAHDGDHCLEIHGPYSTEEMQVNDSPNWVDETPSVAGARYRFSAWVRSPSSTGSKARIRIREYLHRDPKAERVYSSPVVLDGTWRQLTVDYVTTVGHGSLDINVVIDPKVKREVVQVDDVVITRVSPAAISAAELAALTDLQAPPLRFAASIAPNPLRAGGTFEFTTTRPGQVRIAVYDAAGRRVLGLLDGEFVPAGRHQIALGEGRAPLPAGLYFYDLRAGEGALRGRFVVMR